MLWHDLLRVLSGVPQGSVLGPKLFLVYTNDIDLVVENDILKFADDTKLYGIVSDQAQAESLQNDLNGLTLWTSRWQMKFNTDKCSVMHIGARNMQYTYTMNGQVLQQVESQSSLGVIIRKDLKASDQCAKQSICQSQSSIGNDRQKHTIQKY